MKFSRPSSTPRRPGQRHSRQAETVTFRNGGHARWRRALIGIVGSGLLGSNLAIAIVRSGASVGVIDFGVGRVENLGGQPVKVGQSKVESVVDACDAIEPGRAHGFCCDVKHLGVGVLDQFDVLIDCSDDPGLALPLTEISNGLSKCLIRCAVDGTGHLELGRILCSSSGTGHSCQVCAYDLPDLTVGRPKTSCQDFNPTARRPTISGSGVALATVGVTLLSTQRLITGNDDHLVYDRETIIDLTNLQIMPIQLTRSLRCLSGHCRWQLNPIGEIAANLTVGDLFEFAREQLGTARVTLEPYLHPLKEQATCECGERCSVAGTEWARPPECPRCGRGMSWQRIGGHFRISPTLASDLKLHDTLLTQLGFPRSGAMFIARSEKSAAGRFVLDVEAQSRLRPVSQSNEELIT